MCTVYVETSIGCKNLNTSYLKLLVFSLALISYCFRVFNLKYWSFWLHGCWTIVFSFLLKKINRPSHQVSGSHPPQLRFSKFIDFNKQIFAIGVIDPADSKSGLKFKLGLLFHYHFDYFCQNSKKMVGLIVTQIRP